MAFLTSRSASKHVLFALGVDPTARDASKGESSNLASQATHPLQCRARLVVIDVPSLHKSSIAKPRKICQAIAVEFATSLVLALRWLRSNSATDIEYEGEIVQCVVTQKLATCIAYRYT